MKITIKYQSRGRPREYFETLELWIYHASRPAELDIISSFDLDDPTMNNREIIDRLTTYPMLRYFFRNHGNKIAATNADVDVSSGQIIFNVMDDLIPLMSGWDDAMSEDMQKHFPDTDGCLHYFDQLNVHHATIAVMGRKYWQRFGYIYHPSYRSVYTDNEYSDVAKSLGKLRFIDRTIFKHDHWCGGGRKRDDLNERDNQNSAADEANYNRRKSEGFPP